MPGRLPSLPLLITLIASINPAGPAGSMEQPPLLATADILRPGQYGGNGAVACLDMDNDGQLELGFSSFGRLHGRDVPGLQLYRREGEGWVDISTRAGLDMPIGNGMAPADYDNDGFVDLLVSGVFERNRLYRNRGDGTFEEVARAAGVAMEGDGLYRTSASAADVDSDGDLDFFVGNIAGPDALFRNNGDGTFTDVAEQAGVAGTGRTTHHMFGDVDGDNLVDLFVAARNRDLPDWLAPMPSRSALYINRGDGTFRRLPLPSAAATQLESIEGVQLADLDGDLALDIYLTGIGPENQDLYLRNEAGSFRIEPMEDYGDYAMGVEAADLDMDGWLEIAVATAGANRILSFAGGAPGEPRHMQARQHSFIARACDLAGNEAEELIFSNGWSGRPEYSRHEAYRMPDPHQRGRAVRIELEGTQSNRDGYGARLWGIAQGRAAMRDRHGGNGYGGGAPYVAFGLGRAPCLEGLVVRWPAGTLARYGPVRAGSTVTIREGADGTQLPASASSGCREPSSAAPEPGLWLAGGDRYLVVRSQTRPYLVQPGTGTVRALYPQPDGAHAFGSTLLNDSQDAGFLLPVGPRGVFLLAQSRERSQVRLIERSDRIRFRDVRVAGASGELAGTLVEPAGADAKGLVILVHGSGPQNRYGPFGHSHMVAQFLALNGFRAFTFDKRGVGESAGSWADASFDELARDVIAAVDQLSADGAGSTLGLWGISQAGWVMAKVIEARPDVDFAIAVSAAGLGMSAAEQNLANVRMELGAQRARPELIERTSRLWHEAYAMSRGHQESSEFDSRREALLAEGVDEGLLPPATAQIGQSWMAALDLDFDGAASWQGFGGRLLALFGALDTATPSRTVAERLGDSPSRRTIILPDANHFMLQARSGSAEELGSLERIAPGYFEEMARFLSQ